ncbi:unnamed protein product [Cylicocyclus nassatus]|uniref:Uncharacterized protein n=1 Tax=Cylicocyclus nassatus TaxID=53992 RepID=A0AA36GM61_CYLNA|nr:unnamed protein product [Cylicocyclus nassatus]
MFRFVVALLLAVACSADINEEAILNECTRCNLQNVFVKRPEGPIDCQDVCKDQTASCEQLKLAMTELVGEDLNPEAVGDLYEIMSMFVDPGTMCGKVPKSKYGQQLFLGLDSTIGCKVCGMGTNFICKTFFEGETSEKINNAIGSAANKLCVKMKLPKLIEKLKFLGDFDICGKAEEMAKNLLPKIVSPWFCEKEKASKICGKMFKDCTL